MSIFKAISEINEAAFPWYAAMTATLFTLDFAAGGILDEMGISRGALVAFLVLSLMLKAIRRREAVRGTIVRKLKRMTIERLHAAWFALACLGAGIWALVGHAATAQMMRGLGSGASGRIFGYVAFAALIGITAKGAADECMMDEKSSGRESNVEFDMKNAYRIAEERTVETRISGVFPIRKHAHEAEYAAICRHIRPGKRVLDAGCGDGSLSIMLARAGCIMTGCDISPRNVEKARQAALRAGVQAEFIEGDAENLPFSDKSFDYVVSCHVLEHLPNFEQGLAEVRRVTADRAIIAMPTCLSPCAAIIAGGDMFWTVSRWTPIAWLIGTGRILLGLGGEGVNEPGGYRGDPRMPHLWRYPWRMRRAIERAGLEIESFEASSFPLPYAEWLIPLSERLERYRGAPIIRNFGYGSIVCAFKR